MARVPYKTEEDLASEYQDLVVSSLQPGKTANVYSALGNNPEVLQGTRAFLKSLWNHSGLTDRQREIVILTVASEIRSDYEWHQHVNIANKSEIEKDEISALARDDRSHFSEQERALIAYTRATVQGRITDPLHKAMIEYADEETIVGIVATAAGYLALGRIINALNIELETDEGFVGWELTD